MGDALDRCEKIEKTTLSVETPRRWERISEYG